MLNDLEHANTEHANMEHMNMRAVIFEEDGFLVAQCLEKKIVTDTEDGKIETLLTDLLFQIELNQKIAIPPASQKWHDMWETAQELRVIGEDLNIRQVA